MRYHFAQSGALTMETIYQFLKQSYHTIQQVHSQVHTRDMKTYTPNIIHNSEKMEATQIPNN